MRAFTQIDLDVMVAHGCQHPGCKHEHHTGLFLTSRCHPHQGVSVRYSRGGKLMLRCQVCSHPIAEILVAPSLNREAVARKRRDSARPCPLE